MPLKENTSFKEYRTKNSVWKCRYLIVRFLATPKKSAPNITPIISLPYNSIVTKSLYINFAAYYLLHS